LAAGSGYEWQRVALAVIVLKPVAPETAGNRSTPEAATRSWYALVVYMRL